MQRLLLFSLLLGPRWAAGSSQWQKLQKTNPAHYSKFNRGSLGNLRNADEIEDMMMPHGHVFTAEIDVGTPAQVMRCLLDTGSAELWMPSKRCTNCQNKRHFHADESETFMPAVIKTDRGMMPVPVSFNYGPGRVVGFLVQDTVSLGARAFPNQSFIIVEQEDLPTSTSWDGVCGLGWKQEGNAANILADPLYRNKAIAGTRYVFSLVPTEDKETFFTAGEVPTASFKEETMVWVQAEPLVPNDDLTYWLASGGVEFGRKGEALPSKSRFMVDTSTEFILAPAKHYGMILRTLFPGELFDRFCGLDQEAGNLVICDCRIKEAPELATAGLRLHLGAYRTFDLEVEHLFREVDATDGDKICLLQVQKNSRTSFDPMSILGALLGMGAPPASAGGGGRGDGDQPTPPFTLTAQGLLPTGPLPGLGPSGGTQIEEIFHKMPDGRECTNTLVWSKGKLESNTTKCTEGPVDQRRLQMMMPGIIVPTDDPLDDVWVLGAVFLENFVLMMDFENQQLGLALPKWRPTPGPSSVPPQPMHTVRTQVPMDGRLVQTGVLGGTAPSSESGGASFPWGIVLTLATLGGIGGGAAMFYKKANTRKVYGDEEARAQENGLAGGALEEDPDGPDAGDSNAAE